MRNIATVDPRLTAAEDDDGGGPRLAAAEDDGMMGAR